MGNDISHLMFFVSFFIILGLIAPFVNQEFGSSYNENEANIISDDSSSSYSGTTSAWSAVANLFTFAFWTFGFPAWVNLWILLPLRLVFIALIARNIWIGGGG